MQEYQKIAAEALKGLNRDDEEAMEAYQAKIKEPVEKIRQMQIRLSELTTTPEMPPGNCNCSANGY